ncbi:MAG TPA: putative cytokinetic ring protein SteA [Acidimicrobiales bacterium]|nr:putative cytokinetic ring protein SteA [Acidimicrobiales bacterium]
MFAMFARKGASVSVSSGVARVGRRTKELTRHLQPGDVAVIDHEDLDRVAAEGLVNRRVGGVVNAAASLSGRYPNVGPLLLAAAGIPLIDRVGSDVLDVIADGQEIRLEGNEIWHDGILVASGVRQDLDSLERDYEAAKLAVGAELERFAENTLEYLREEHQSVLGSLRVPDLKTRLQGRQVLVVVRGADYRDDLAHLRSYVREIRPVLVGVDGGADALLEFGLKPHVILGDFDSVSDQALRCGAELVVHAYPGGKAPGAARLEELNVPHLIVEASGTSEDVAMLLAYEQGAELIVAVGSHASMVDFLDKGRGGMASTFLTRLKIGQLLVDAKGVSKLYESRIRKRDLVFFLLAAMLCFVVVIVAVFPRVFLESFWLLMRESWRSLSH